ncbi:MAG: hypothetical protein A4E56_01908 [Pelotomaculum sp. PtaU1.Bin065]|nr:MAG: hypothetical protein A4E56_01908 [Pelotomaculum sp. PtaU1.Bin065]
MPILPVLEEEFERLKSMEKGYLEKLALLPKGSIRTRVLKGRTYRYLVYRSGGRVINKYLKLSKEELDELEFQIAQRQKFEKALRDICQDCRILEKVLRC